MRPDQSGGDFAERIGEEAIYAFVYPNFMLNRYGPILDTKLGRSHGATTARA